jgi:ectoine hydroxylase-related dioxygenase (phytanoyl-CoA dioxygenase family)
MAGLTISERQQLDRDGYLPLEGIVNFESVVAMRRRLDELLAATPQDHAGTLIVGGLLSEEVFDAAWKHSRVLDAVESLLGDSYRMTSLSSRGLRPGHGQQALHVDWAIPGDSGAWYACHAICALVEFTRDNGATRVVPGSHRNPWLLQRVSDLRKPHPAQRQLVGAAGTVFILNIHCAHSAVHNSSDEPRLAVFANFSRRDSPLLTTNPIPDPSPETLARHSIAVQKILTQ